MTKKILITGATDGIGFEAAKKLAAEGHHLLIHGRSAEKLATTEAALTGAYAIERYRADFARLDEVAGMADALAAKHDRLDVIINNAGVLKTGAPIAPNGMDTRLVVNMLAPCLLTHRLLPRLGADARVINLSSAAQAPVDLDALTQGKPMQDMDAYAQSKLAITMWSRAMALRFQEGPLFVAVNPGSLLATNMVRDGFGIAGNDIQIGADILYRAALSEEFEGRSGAYYDNDAKRFGPPHSDAQDDAACLTMAKAVEALLPTS